MIIYSLKFTLILYHKVLFLIQNDMIVRNCHYILIYLKLSALPLFRELST